MMPRRDSDASDRRAAETHSETTVHQLRGEVVTVIGNIHQSLSCGSLDFSADRTVEVAKDRADAIQELVVAADRWIDDVLSELEKRRTLLLCGDDGSGKSTLALYLATRLARRRGLRRTLFVNPLEPNVEVDLLKIASHNDDFAPRTTIFADAFSRGNHPLLDFFSRSDVVAWDQLTTALRDQHAYVIFTTHPDAIASFRQRIAGVTLREVPPLDRPLVERGFERRLQWLERRGRLTSVQVRLLSDGRKQLIDDLETLPGIARFLDQLTPGDSNVDAALQRLHNIPLWFAKDLTADIDAWCFALTLALAQSVRREAAIGWFAFDRVRRAVTAHIKSSPEFLSRPSCSGQMLSDELILGRVRAEVIGERTSFGCAVRFINSAYAETIWQTAAAHHRRVLTGLVPALRLLAEDERGAGSYEVRSLAAQMIGRIGELDPLSISIPLVQDDWRTRNPAQRRYTGRVLQAMRTSSSRAYQQAALSIVDSLLAHPRELPAVISAYALIGEQEPVLAMRELGAIAIREVAPVMAKLEQIREIVEKIEHHLSVSSSRQLLDDLVSDRTRLEHISGRLSAQHAANVIALQQAVAYLCLTNDPMVILCAMKEWMAGGGTAFVAALFLDDGIAARVEAAATNLQALTGKRHSNRIVASLANEPGSIDRAGVFLAELLAGICNSTPLSARSRRHLLDRFAATLTAWAVRAIDDRAAADVVAALLVSLLNAENETLHQTIAALLKTQPFTENEALRNFAAAVRSKQCERKGKQYETELGT